MEPTFFGDQEAPLFGIYHPPLQTPVKGNAVLICYPLFQEHIRTHRALRQLAEQLAKTGSHVFRFDYYGTGDSAGSLDEVNLTDWLENVATAEKELKEISGARYITLIGLRFGATLATMHRSKYLNKLILWDPVIDGKKYIDDLTSLHSRLLVDSDRFPKPRERVDDDSAKEILGFRVSDVLSQQIQACSMPDQINSDINNVTIIVSEDQQDYQELKLQADEADSNLSYLVVSGPGNWNDLGKLEDTLIPSMILDQIVNQT